MNNKARLPVLYGDDGLDTDRDDTRPSGIRARTFVEDLDVVSLDMMSLDEQVPESGEILAPNATSFPPCLGGSCQSCSSYWDRFCMMDYSVHCGCGAA